eukprot:1321190-Amorphochlora_amoeboformis.AAC.1
MTSHKEEASAQRGVHSLPKFYDQLFSRLSRSVTLSQRVGARAMSSRKRKRDDEESEEDSESESDSSVEKVKKKVNLPVRLFDSALPRMLRTK